MNDLIFNCENHIGFITLNRGQALNALTLPMIKALQIQLQHWEADPAIHAMVIQAPSGKAFCAGGDVRWLYEAGKVKDPQQMEFFWHEYRLNHFIHHLSKPFIALMNGITMGGGVGISLHGSHPVASENFIFAMPETAIGFFPDIGSSHLLTRLPAPWGIYLGLSGNRINGEKAYQLGLVKYYMASESFNEFLQDIMQADLSLHAHKVVHSILSRYVTPQRKSIEDLQSHMGAFFHVEIEDIFQTLTEGSDDWHAETLKNLKQKAPLSLKITLEQLKKAKSLNLAQCLQMDYHLVSHFMEDHDFYEGVRAMLIDKDKKPVWNPKNFNDISLQKIEEYFSSRHKLEFQD